MPVLWISNHSDQFAEIYQFCQFTKIWFLLIMCKVYNDLHDWADFNYFWRFLQSISWLILSLALVLVLIYLQLFHWSHFAMAGQSSVYSKFFLTLNLWLLGMRISCVFCSKSAVQWLKCERFYKHHGGGGSFPEHFSIQLFAFLKTIFVHLLCISNAILVGK